MSAAKNILRNAINNVRGGTGTKQQHQEHRRRRSSAIIAGTASVAVVSSVAIRSWREDRLVPSLPLARTCGVFYCQSVWGRDFAAASAGVNNENTHLATDSAALPATLLNDGNARNQKPSLRHTEHFASSCKVDGKRVPRREVESLATTVRRAGLMGKAVSVQEELDSIRRWHRDRGFLGGLILRDLNRPLYDGLASGGEEDEEDFLEGGDDVEPIPRHQLNQRECYYLYYEILGNGEVKQQIFCRGTTIREDVFTGLKCAFRYDSELGCRLHWGFREHADRLLNDVEPLLTSPGDRRSTVELCGHSLGGAVAMIVALKLKKRGHNVVRVTTVGAPKFCDSDAGSILVPLLPPDTLRIEHDLDAVPYLPPLVGRHLGHKLWFVTKHCGQEEGQPRFVPDGETIMHGSRKWVDSTFVNWRTPEIAYFMPSTHKVRSYASHIDQLAADMKHGVGGSSTRDESNE